MSKIKQFTIKATIPTGSYANIQPEITVETESVEEAKSIAMPHIKSMFAEYSDVPLKSRGEPVILKSFNEGLEISFDPVSHSYLYKGQPLMSASGFVKQYSKEFDKFGISKASSEKWGIPQQDILDLWEGNGKISAGFGTAIHAVLEHYFKYRSIGQTILEKSSKKVNAALPNHPFLQQLILDLEKLDTEPGIEHQEVLVSNVQMGYCGLIDKLKILDEKKKICRVQDYKITYDIEKPGDKMLAPFDELSPTKLSKYLVQLSFYGNLLEMSGWNVQGLDIFNYDGSWSRHKLEPIKVI